MVAADDSFQATTSYDENNAGNHFKSNSGGHFSSGQTQKSESASSSKKSKKGKGRRHSNWTRGVPEEAFALHTIFTKYDHSRRGFLDIRGLSSMLIETMWDSTQVPGSLGAQELPSQEDIEGMMRFLDSDGNMMLERQEFVVWICGGLRKSEESLAKFARKGNVQTLLVKFLQAIRVQRDLYLTAFSSVFGEDSVIEVNSFWDMLEQARTGTNFAQFDSTKLPPLGKILHTKSTGNNLTVPRQAMIDFMVHGYVAKRSMHQVQKTLHARIGSIMNDKVLATKASLTYATGNPFLVLATAVVFHSQDVNGDNVVDAKEFRRLLIGPELGDESGSKKKKKKKKKKGKLKLNPAEIQRTYDAIDSNNDGLIDKEEFLSFAVPVLSKKENANTPEQVLLSKALLPRVEEAMATLQKSHATLIRIFRRSANSREECSIKELTNMLKICHRRAPRPAPEVNENSVNAMMKVLIGETGAAALDENTFVGQSLLLINMPPGMVEERENSGKLGLMSMQMVGLLESECGYLLSMGGGGGAPLKRNQSQSYQNANSIFESDSDEDSEEDGSFSDDSDFSDVSDPSEDSGNDTRDAVNVQRFDW